MPKLSALKNDVLSIAHEAPSFVIERELLRAAEELLVETEAWQVTNDTLAIKRLSDYEVETPAHTYPVRVDWVLVDGDALEAVDPKRFAQRKTGATSKPTAFSVSNGTLSVAPTPDRNYPMQVRAVVAPDDLAADLDRLTFAKVKHAVIAGAVANIALTPGRWYDERLGNYYRQIYDVRKMELARKSRDTETRPVYVTQYGGI